jgi:Winged helix-turn helix
MSKKRSRLSSARGMRRWLVANGFTHHKPTGAPLKADPEAQRVFLEHYSHGLSKAEKFIVRFEHLRGG